MSLQNKSAADHVGHAEDGASMHEPSPDVTYGEHYNNILIVDPVETFEAFPRSSVLRRESFLMEFATSNGPPQIVLLMMLLALGFGSTIGVVPAVTTDRYARLLHGYTGVTCSSFSALDKPQECLDGSADAQNAAAFSNFVSDGLTFITSCLIGSISDERGRKGIMVLGITLSSLSPLCLVLLQLFPSMSPTWYYAAGAVTGLVNWIAVALSALSDVMPPKWRAPSFGLLLAGFSLGFAFAPTLALFLDHLQVSFLALTTVLIGLCMTACCFPETLSPHAAAEARRSREVEVENASLSGKITWNLLRPFREISILNRNRLFRLLSVLAFFSGMVASADRTLLLYYVEERLSFTDHDVAVMFSMIGLLGIFAQAVVLKPLNDCVGEKIVVTICFFLGAIDNFMYGVAKTKRTIFAAVAISAFTGMAFPTISAIKSMNVLESEQGRVQGALYSIQALASGTGPVVLRYVYHHTKNGAFFGPGTMFVFASGLYLVASACACALPGEQADSRRKQPARVPPVDLEEEKEDSIETALL